MDIPSYITAEEAAEILRTSPSNLAKWRMEGDGPSYFKRKGRVLYTAAAIAEYMTAHEHVTVVETLTATPSLVAKEVGSADEDEWLSPAEAGATLRASPATLSRWRVQGSGPEYIKRGGRIFYTPSAIRAFAEGNTRTKTREPFTGRG